MKHDRKKICGIMSDMLDNPDIHGIYPTSTAYTRLEHYVEQVRMGALGWMHAANCIELDKGNDPRTIEVPEILSQACKELQHEL